MALATVVRFFVYTWFCQVVGKSLPCQKSVDAVLTVKKRLMKSHFTSKFYLGLMLCLRRCLPRPLCSRTSPSILYSEPRLYLLWTILRTIPLNPCFRLKRPNRNRQPKNNPQTDLTFHDDSAKLPHRKHRNEHPTPPTKTTTTKPSKNLNKKTNTKQQLPLVPDDKLTDSDTDRH